MFKFFRIKEEMFMENVKFYICENCGQVVVKVKDTLVPLVCCGRPMKELEANTSDASQEKHVPVVTITGKDVEVKVGSTLHPMTNEHYISHFILETNKTVRTIKITDPTMHSEPIVHFTLAEGEVVKNAYAFCNLHSLWKTIVNK